MLLPKISNLDFYPHNSILYTYMIQPLYVVSLYHGSGLAHQIFSELIFSRA